MAKKTPKPARVSLTNTKRANGKVGAIAKPLASEKETWIAAGWAEADQGDET